MVPAACSPGILLGQQAPDDACGLRWRQQHRRRRLSRASRSSSPSGSSTTSGARTPRLQLAGQVLAALASPAVQGIAIISLPIGGMFLLDPIDQRASSPSSSSWRHQRHQLRRRPRHGRGGRHRRGRAPWLLRVRLPAVGRALGFQPATPAMPARADAARRPSRWGFLPHRSSIRPASSWATPDPRTARPAAGASTITLSGQADPERGRRRGRSSPHPPADPAARGRAGRAAVIFGLVVDRRTRVPGVPVLSLDKQHLHHRLLEMAPPDMRAVILMYA